MSEPTLVAFDPCGCWAGSAVLRGIAGEIAQSGTDAGNRVEIVPVEAARRIFTRCPEHSKAEGGCL